MKRALRFIIAGMLLAGATSCLADLETRVDTLEDQVSTILTSLDQLERYVKAQVYVSKVETSAKGYILTLSNGETMLLKHGQDGLNGQDGQDGKDGVSIVDGIDGIKGVRISGEYVVFVLSEGGELALPRSPKVIEIQVTGCEVDADKAVASFTVKDALDPVVIACGPASWDIEVSEVSGNAGTVTIRRSVSDEKAASGTIALTVVDNASAGANTNTKAWKLKFEDASFNATLWTRAYPVEGGELSLSYSANMECEFAAPDWITPVQTKAVKEYSRTFRVLENTGARREGAVAILVRGEEQPVASMNVVQKGVFTRMYILSEGGYGANNASLSYYNAASGEVTDSWFSTVNGSKLGDTGNDILLTEDYIIIAVNASNIIQFCSHDGKAVAQTEAVANVRKLAVDPEGEYLYATSYADNGCVAKISLEDFSVVAKVNVGYEPEGIAWYDGKLFVANSGGYSYMGGHDYEETISVIDAASMTETKRVKTGKINLYGAFVQNARYPRYILVNAAGDYMSNPAASLVFDCEKEEVVATFDFPATYASQYEGAFYSIGSSFSYVTYAYEYSFKKIDMASGTPVVTDGLAPEGGSASDAITEAVKKMAAPYGICIASNGEVFVTDAGNYVNRGSLHRFAKDGKGQTTFTVGVCPGHFAENL